VIVQIVCPEVPADVPVIANVILALNVVGVLALAEYVFWSCWL
jgi:hypothetical protein